MKQWTQDDLNALLLEAYQEAAMLGIPLSSQVSKEVYINQRAKARLGACKANQVQGKRFYQIELSAVALGGTREEIKTILLHELLHTCPNCMNHGKLWKSYAELLNWKIGYAIKRTATFMERESSAKRGKRGVQYLLVCKNCGMTYQRKNKSKAVLHPENYRCGKCRGGLVMKEING
ncbi:MAG: SprT-like domain-containing protein [Anaerovoracaceae bacterium]